MTGHYGADVTTYQRLSGPVYHGDFVGAYDRFRPQPPDDLFELLLALAPQPRPALVVDLGCGTGISTVPWANRAERVVGIDLNADMLRAARPSDNVEYRCAPAHETGLPSGCADIVTCAQAFHWMQRDATIAEAARVLRGGGVFAAYDYDWPPVVDWEVDAAFLAVLERSGIDVARPEKADHLERMDASGCFQHLRETLVHRREAANAERIVGLAFVFGPLARRLADGATEEELGLNELRHVVERRVGSGTATLWWSYRVRAAQA